MKDRAAYWLCFLLVLLNLSSAAAPPIVTNVVASQRAQTSLVDIRYDLLDSDSARVTVRIEISADGGRTFSVPALSLTGDVGRNVAPGPGKRIVWNAGLDWDGEYSPQMAVKVLASDGDGLPGLEWGAAIAPGGFLMGQDGGPEGAGPSRHINVPWSCWIGQYEVTVGQYVDYLNMALAADEIYRDPTKVYARAGRYEGLSGGEILLVLGADIEWSISRFVAVVLTNLPVLVTWHGAVAFARHYGYDLPTEAEWEKGARGAAYDGGGEHQIYPWGNIIRGGHANYHGSGDPFNGGRSPVGYFDGSQTPEGPVMTNSYGLYDVIGNAAEWTRTLQGPLETYPQLEQLADSRHALAEPGARIVRGGSYLDAQGSTNLRCHGRTALVPTLMAGFRVVRRSASVP